MNKRINYDKIWEMILGFVIITSGIILWAVIEMSESASFWYILPSAMIILTSERLLKSISRDYKRECQSVVRRESQKQVPNTDNWYILETYEMRQNYEIKPKRDKPIRKFVI